MQSRKRPDFEGASVDTWLEGGGVGADGDLSLPTCATVARFSVFLRLPLSLHPQHLSLIIRFYSIIRRATVFPPLPSSWDARIRPAPTRWGIGDRSENSVRTITRPAITVFHRSSKQARKQPTIHILPVGSAKVSSVPTTSDQRISEYGVRSTAITSRLRMPFMYLPC